MVSPFPEPPPPPTWASDLLTVGVTGTNGKTSTTSWIAAALGRVARPVARATTLGLFLDDARLDLPADYEAFIETMRRCRERGGRFAAIELTSEALARGFVRSWPCKVGVFTNLTHDHLDAHGSFEHYLASKAQLFVHLPAGGTAVLNGCDESCELLAEVVPEGARVVRYGVPSRGVAKAPLDVRATKVDVTWDGTRATIETTDRVGRLVDAATSDALPREIRTSAIGDVFAENALAAWTGAVAAGVPPDVAAKAIADAPAPPGRFEVIASPRAKGRAGGGRGADPRVVVDYAHTPDALARTLATARALCEGTLVVVFGAGGDRDQNKRGPMGVAARVADRVVLTNDNPRSEDPASIVAAIREGLAGHGGIEVELDRERAIARALEGMGARDVVVIAGKGHEVEQVALGGRRSFSDAEVARATLSGSRSR